jgi:hypothetical protein
MWLTLGTLCRHVGVTTMRRRRSEERGAQLTRPSMLAIGTTLRQPQHIE